MSIEQPNRVLVVDDDSDVRDLLTTVLRQRSLAVDAAADGQEALDLMREQQYAVIILDILMPVMDGFGVLDAMSRIEGSSPPVVLVLTGADRMTIEQLDAQRIHGIVRKPFDPEELASLVAACAEIKGRSPFEAMAMAMIAGGPFLAWLSGKI